MSADGQTITLRRYAGDFPVAAHITSEWLIQNKDHVRKAVALDLETTGLNTATDRIIEIAVRLFYYHKVTGEILRVNQPYNELQDPGVELSPRVKFVTGLDNDQLRGKQIDWERVENELAQADLVIAHNASFDRPFMERYSPSTAEKVWGCSLKQVDWERGGFPIQKLEILSLFHGFFVDAHRALGDVDALIYLLSMKDESTGESYFAELLKNARRRSSLVRAVNSSFDSKDRLRERGYSWEPFDRCWQKQMYQDEIDREVKWLETDVYGGVFGGVITEIPLNGTFRSRSKS
jgi:DNA polymerase-3 subunit epsilon